MALDEMMCQYVINYNKWSTLMGYIDSGQSDVWDRGYKKNLYFPLNISVNLKLLQNTKPIKNAPPCS